MSARVAAPERLAISMHAATSCHGPVEVASSTCHGSPVRAVPSQRTGLDVVAEKALANADVGTGCAGRIITTHSISGSGAIAARSTRRRGAHDVVTARVVELQRLLDHRVVIDVRYDRSWHSHRPRPVPPPNIGSP